MYILGISCFFHDAAAALLCDGKLAAAAEEERFTRIKHDSRFPERAVRFCLDHAGITARDLDYVVFYEKPFNKFDRILMTAFQGFPRSWRTFAEAMMGWLGDKLWIKNIIRSKVGVAEDRILFEDHHLSHAASAFYPSPFEEAAILTIDGVGEWTTASFGRGKDTEITIRDEIRFPHSLGLLYGAFTAFLGFRVNEGEGNIVGMTPYGKPEYADKIYDHLIRVADDGSFRINLDYFSYHYSDERIFNDRFVRLFGEPRDPEMPFFTSRTGTPFLAGERPAGRAGLCKLNEHYADVAASIQKVTEEIILKLARTAHERTGLSRLCMAGGVALNSAANGRILLETPLEELFIQPAAGDSGGALGAALHAWHALLGNPRSFILENPYWGEAYSEEEIRSFLDQEKIPYERFGDDDKLLDRVVDDLVGQKVVGWFQGRFEWGPRALGNRSILADPRSEQIKDVVNTKIKAREPFSPFAAVVLEESVQDFFLGKNISSQYPAKAMMLTLPFKDGQGKKVGAVNHGGSGRLQSISEGSNPRLYRVVEEFSRATGVPALLNTSLNLKGDPIVATPADAYAAFRSSGLDVLVLENFMIRK